MSMSGPTLTLKQFRDDPDAAKKMEPALLRRSMAFTYGKYHVKVPLYQYRSGDVGCVDPLAYYRLQTAVFQTLLLLDRCIHDARRWLQLGDGAQVPMPRLEPWTTFYNQYFRHRALGILLEDGDLAVNVPEEHLPLDVRLNLNALEHM